MEWTSNGEGAPSDLRAVPKVSVERYQFSCLRRNLGGAKDELGMGVGLQEDEGDLVLDGLGSDAGGIAVVVVDVRFGVAHDLGDGDGATILALLLGGHRRAGHIMDAAGDGRIENGGAEVFVGSVADALASSLLVEVGVDIDIDGSKVVNLFRVQNVGIRFDGRGERGWREDGRSAEQEEDNGGRSRTEHLEEECLGGAGWLVGLVW